MEFTEQELEALGRMVTDWIHEGFTTPPYEDVYYDVFEKLPLDVHEWNRSKIRRPEEKS